MAYSTKNCMVSKEQAEEMRRREKERAKRLKEVTNRAIEFYKKYKEDIIKHLSETRKEP